MKFKIGQVLQLDYESYRFVITDIQKREPEGDYQIHQLLSTGATQQTFSNDLDMGDMCRILKVYDTWQEAVNSLYFNDLQNNISEKELNIQFCKLCGIQPLHDNIFCEAVRTSQRCNLHNFPDKFKCTLQQSDGKPCPLIITSDLLYPDFLAPNNFCKLLDIQISDGQSILQIVTVKYPEIENRAHLLQCLTRQLIYDATSETSNEIKQKIKNSLWEF